MLHDMDIGSYTAVILSSLFVMVAMVSIMVRSLPATITTLLVMVGRMGICTKKERAFMSPLSLMIMVCGLDDLAPVFLCLAHIAAVAELGHALGLCEEFLCLVGISLLYAQITNLAEQEVAEIAPVRLF